MTDILTVHRNAHGRHAITPRRRAVGDATTLRRHAVRNAATASVGALVMAGALGFAIAIPPAGTLHDRLAAGWATSPQTR
jgi:hypothetical protein